QERDVVAPATVPEGVERGAGAFSHRGGEAFRSIDNGLGRFAFMCRYGFRGLARLRSNVSTPSRCAHLHFAFVPQTTTPPPSEGSEGCRNVGDVTEEVSEGDGVERLAGEGRRLGGALDKCHARITPAISPGLGLAKHRPCDIGSGDVGIGAREDIERESAGAGRHVEHTKRRGYRRSSYESLKTSGSERLATPSRRGRRKLQS